ncbi:MAG: RIP metalloprotease RseP [Deltaproteobacteria bacterium RIFCSPLOWO2_02_FULL_53_8]|nr:MAG: RIP metalloprotease RseP [Deltaproteobacteria bacterium RIFCSPLOWO2_02_FULL_53_8]
MTTFIAFIVVLGVLIFIHELGHFAVAKLGKVGVEKFSLGFGPRVIGYKYGETDYVLSLLPLGGYVKMVGEAPDEEVSEEDKARSFTYKPIWLRAAIVAAGPLMNLVLAAILFPVIFMIGVDVPAFLNKPALVGFVEQGKAGANAGIRKGDLIEEIDGEKIDTWEELLTRVTLNPGQPLALEIERNHAEITVTLTPDTHNDTGAGFAGIYPPIEPIIDKVSDGYPAKEAGIASGDRIVSINGVEITHWAELEDVIRKDGLKKSFVVSRDGKLLTFEIIPKYNEEMKYYLIGISRKEVTSVRKYGFVEGVEKGLAAGGKMTVQLFVVLKGLVTGQYSLKTLGGPIMIAKEAGRAASSGVADTLLLVAFLSLQLGIINLFPMPVLDGGHILFFCIEAVKGKPLSERFMVVAQQIGIALLITLMVLVTYNDILKLFSRGG